MDSVAVVYVIYAEHREAFISKDMYPNIQESNPRFPHNCVITRKAVPDNPMEDEGEETVIYEGICRSYDFHTTSTAGEVLTSTRKLSLPVRQQEWNEEHPIPLEGDLLVVNKGSHTEYGIVLDKMPGNLGTHLLWKYIRN